MKIDMKRSGMAKYRFFILIVFSVFIHMTLLLSGFRRYYDDPAAGESVSFKLVSISEDSDRSGNEFYPSSHLPSEEAPLPSRYDVGSSAEDRGGKEETLPTENFACEKKDELSEAGRSVAVSMHTGPVPLSPISPVYPVSARRSGAEGAVIVALFIDKEGRVKKADIKKSSGKRILDNAALSSLKRCKFSPGRKYGLPVEDTLTVEIVFRLKDER